MTLSNLKGPIWGLALGLMVSFTGPLAADDMLPIADGIPRMGGMTMRADSFSSFDTASGRIETVEAEISADRDRQQVMEFYRNALTALGWRQAGAENAAAFLRDSEALLITISRTREVLVVRFDLRPAGR
mgnify:FL=1